MKSEGRMKRKMRARGGLLAGMLGLAVALSGCAASGMDVEYNYPTSGPGGLPTYEKQESLFGEDGLALLGGSSSSESAAAGSGIPVNTFLWRASLDTVSFMPLASADPFGGVIITEWYTPPDAPEERFKVNIFILDRALRSDGVRATVFRQARGGAGQWLDSPQKEDLDRRLEDAILTRARQLRIQNAGG